MKGDRLLTCVDLWFSGAGLTLAEFYEASTDKINELSGPEVVDLFEKRIIQLHQPEKGKKV